MSFRLASDGLWAALVRQFADGHWHTIDEAVAMVGHIIPPEIALRRLKRTAPDAPVVERIEKGRSLVVSVVIKSHGTEQQAINGGRRAFRIPIGTSEPGRHPNTKLSDEQVRDIRRRHDAGGVTMKQLAPEYGVSPSQVSNVIHRKCWAHVE